MDTRSTKYYLGFFLALVLAMGGMLPTAGQAQQVQKNGGLVYYPAPLPTPALLIYNGDGRQLTFADFKGKVVLLNLWGTWCAPCVIEMPSLNKLQRRYERAGLEIIAVAINDTPQTVKQFFREHNLQFLDVYTDSEKNVSAAFNVRTVPSTFLINREGKVVAYYGGADDWMEDWARTAIENLLREDMEISENMPSTRAPDANAGATAPQR